MANVWAIAGMTSGIAGCVAVLSLFLNPSINWYLVKFFSLLSFDAPRKLRDLEINTIPKLKETLREVEKQKMLRSAEKARSKSNDELDILNKLTKDLRSALYEAEDILDLNDYSRIERRVISDAEPTFQPYLQAVGAFVARCRGAWSGLVAINRPPAPHWAQRWGAWFGAVINYRPHVPQLMQFMGTRATPRGSPAQPPMPLEPSSNSVVQRLGGWYRSINISSSFRPMLAFLSTVMQFLFSFLRYCWAWAKLAGIKVIKMGSIAIHSFLDIFDRIGLSKRIEHIEHILNDSMESHLLKQQSSSSSNNISSRQEHDYMYRRIEQKVFGRDKDRENICKMLRVGPDAYGASSSSRKPYSLIVIHGIAGSGKTTLAQYVYHYEKDQGNYFDPVMFILVSTRFKLSDIFRDMLEQIDNVRPKDDRDPRSLHDELSKKLRGQRFLLVLDDLWIKDEDTRKDLECVLHALDGGQIGSRILVTARTEGVAAALNAQVQEEISMSKLELDKEQYLRLFMHHARQDIVDHDREFERIGREIAKKLHRSPIAAVAVARGLQEYKNIDSWKTAANLDVLNHTMGALWWSYDQLSVDIRRCFQFCRIFPRGYKLQRDKLVGMWIAHGFVKPGNESEDLEDVGQRYFHELLTFSFLQETATTGLETGHFIIHDLLHELAERVAGNDFFRVDLNASTKNIPADVHHLFIETYERAKIKEKDLELVNLRTLIIEETFPSNKEVIATNPKYWLPSSETILQERRDLAKEEVFQSMFLRLRKLRVLIVHVCCSDDLVFSVPESIGQMKHLRYLGFRTVNILEMIFPRKFTKLYHMQILDCPYVKLSYPRARDMSNLIHLRHIYGHLDFPKNIGRLTALQTLPAPEFTVHREQGYELMQLKNLNKLRGTLVIYGLGTVGSEDEALEANLACKKRITELTLDFRSHCFDANVESDVLEGLCPPENLEKLHIWHYHGSRYPSWMLSGYPGGPDNINLLEFNGCSRLVSIPKDSQFFSRLHSLEIFECDWDSLPDNMECLRMLHTLIITYCYNIQVLPILPISLQRIQIMGSSSRLWRSCKQPQHINWKRISRIPTREFY